MRRKVLTLSAILLLLVFIFVSIIGNNTTSAAFTKSGNTNISVECGSFSDKFVVEIYDGSTLINSEDLEFDKEYTVKVYNNSTMTCDFYLSTEGTEINTFSNGVSINITHNNSLDTISVQNGFRLPTVKKIIQVTDFEPSEEPLVFNLTISTQYVRLMAQKSPSSIKDFDFDLKLSFIAETVAQ